MTYSQATITFLETSYVVNEGDMFSVEVLKSGVAASNINVVVQVP